jgi:hypothetical protein
MKFELEKFRFLLTEFFIKSKIRFLGSKKESWGVEEKFSLICTDGNCYVSRKYSPPNWKNKRERKRTKKNTIVCFLLYECDFNYGPNLLGYFHYFPFF